jgi:ParB family transcriptional regulator, chromosome partitioning protein
MPEDTSTHSTSTIETGKPKDRHAIAPSQRVRVGSEIARRICEKVEVSQISVEPERVKVWAGNARHSAGLYESKCRDLIDSIIATGGQKVPVVLRQVAGDPHYDFELIVGARRLWAVSFLRANGYPHIKLTGVVQSLTDEQAFVLSDAENRARKDVSDIERARNYAMAVNSIFGGNQTLMASKLGVSKGWLSKMLSVAALPETVLLAFEYIQTISLAALYSVTTLMKDPEMAIAIIREAAVVADEQGNRYWDKTPPISTPEVIRRLKAVANPRPQQPTKFEARGSNGQPMLTVLADDDESITLRLHSGSGADRQEIMQAVAQAMDWVESKRVSLRP